MSDKRRSGLFIAGLAFAAGAQAVETSYLTPVDPGVTFTPILNVGDKVGRYGLVGIPDGMGAYDNNDGSFTLLLNHEAATDKGIARDHGSIGGFVSRWIINKSDLRVLYGSDMVTAPANVMTWNGAGWISGTTAFNRPCSADLPALSAFKHGKMGYDGRIFMNGEESDGGRGFAWIASGSEAGMVYELPSLGKFAWENALASPHPSKKTIVIGLDDDGLTDSELYVYIGEKRETGNAVEKAGLHGGTLYAVRVLGDGAPQVEDANTAFGANVRDFSLVNLGDVSAKDGVQLENESLAAGASMFRRIEDGAWDTKNPNVFYFVTTADFNTKSRLWKLTFKNVKNPAMGGKIELLLDGGDGSHTVRMLDNMTVASDGSLVLQEDPGNQSYLARIWKFNVKTRLLTELAVHDATRFDGTDGTISDGTADDYHTQDEESSGVIEVTDLFKDVDGYDTRVFQYFLVAVQAHKAYHPAWTPDEKNEYIEGGQLLLMRTAK